MSFLVHLHHWKGPQNEDLSGFFPGCRRSPSHRCRQGIFSPHPASQHEATQRQLHRQRWQRLSVAVAAERRGQAAEDGQPRGADEGPLPAPAISQGAEQQLTSHHPKQHGADHQGLRFGRNQGFTIVKLQNQHHQIDGEKIIGIRQEANATGQHSQAFQGLAIFGHQRRRLISAFLHCAMGKPRGSTPQGAWARWQRGWWVENVENP